MQWALNSSRPARVGELGAVLREEVEHFERTLDIRLAKNKLAAMEAAARGQSAEPEQDSPTSRNEHHARVLEQMKSGIGAAVAVASTLGTGDSLFLASVSGHFDPNHEDGIEERMSIFVDIAPEPALEG